MSTRTRISTEATELLKALEKKTRLTPNILARLAIALSLEDPAPFTPIERDHAGLEFNHSTLYGEHELIYQHLAIQWAGSPKDTDKILREHLERGIGRLRDFLSTRTLADLAKERPTLRSSARSLVKA